MKYEEFKQKLNLQVFGEDVNYEILTTVIKNPNRYIGLFRVTNAKTKLIQNITQSCEIKFGDFIEDILTQYILDTGYHNLDKNIGVDENNDELNVDQLFKNNNENIIYIIEQKIRDDHDSTKKRGQYANFIKKIKLIKTKFKNHKIKATMWFSDDSLKKNRKYYLEQIQNNTDDIVEINIFYGKELFVKLFNRFDIWNEFTLYLDKCKRELNEYILNIVNFDNDEIMKKMLLKMQTKDPDILNKLLSDKQKYINLRKELSLTDEKLSVIF
ncbi:MAG: hypothetical protein IJ566_04120 [Cardiobacteriaceae bacterium]|nr:hypothetical protein [Cardiobacteriaceae bacterium]